MFSRYFFAFCLVFFVVAVANVSAEEVDNDVSLENLNIVSQVKKVRETLKKFFKHATEDCIITALKNCRRHWFNNMLIKCAEDLFIVKNIACILGKQ